MFEFGLRLGKVFKVNYSANTVDVLLDSGFGVVRDVPIAFTVASTNTILSELPVLKTVQRPSTGNNEPVGVVFLQDGQSETEPDLYHLENTVPGKINLDDPTTNYAYAIVAGLNERYGKINPVCIGFLLPHRNQVLFDPDNVSSDLDVVVQQAVERLKGALVHRTNSGVYWTVDLNGNMEWAHPNGSFIRIAEDPTTENDGVVHVDLTKANKRAKNGTDATNLVWDTTQQVGVDDALNSERELYAHIEIKTAKGVVMIEINKDTGDVIIKTPMAASDSSDADSNKLTIVCGGNATLQSVQGDVQIQSVQGQVSIEANTGINLITDTAEQGSIVIGANGDNGTDNMVLLRKLEQKFNNHQHICTGSGNFTTGPNKQIDSGDATTVTVAG